MAREVRLVLLAAGVVALLGAAALWLGASPPPEADPRVTFSSREPLDIARLHIKNAHGVMAVTFTGEGYLVDDIPPEIVDMEEFLDLLAHAGRVEALRTVTLAPEDLAAYGLAAPEAQVAVEYSDGALLTLRIGAEERVSGGRYVQVLGDPAVHLLEAERCAPFLLPKRAYVEDLVTPRLARSSPLSALLDVTLSGGSLAESVKIEAVAAGSEEVRRASLALGAPTHIVRRRGVYELDQTYAVEMLGPLLGITAQDVVGYRLTPEQVRTFGFDQPTMEISFDLKNGVDAAVQHYDLAVLRKDGAYYMTRNDEGVIYTVPEPTFLRVEAERLAVRWFLSPLLMDVRGVEVATGGEAYSFALSGETNADRRVTCNGEPLDIARFRTLYGLLTSAAHDGALREGLVPEGEPLLRLTYHYLDEDKAPDTMELYPGETRRLVVSVNGVTELAMREAYLSRVQEALRVLWTDEPLEREW